MIDIKIIKVVKTKAEINCPKSPQYYVKTCEIVKTVKFQTFYKIKTKFNILTFTIVRDR